MCALAPCNPFILTFNLNSMELRKMSAPFAFEPKAATKSYSRQLVRVGNLPSQPNTSAERKPWLPPDKNSLIVDVGCAWGTLLLELRQLGYGNLMGVEGDSDLAREAAKRCEDHGIRIIHSDASGFFERTDQIADAVLLFHLIEHFPPKDGVRLLESIREHLRPGGQIVIEVPNLSSVTGMHMRYSDVTHATGYTEYGLKQLLDDAGFENPTVVCVPPPLRWWRLGRQGSGLAWHLNRRIHKLLYELTNAGPRPTCFCPVLMVTAIK
jgi:2-polyprenyl-3-methyl-5-hydroxy-6-metoxy-1,4-benzoquinol methylase